MAPRKPVEQKRRTGRSPGRDAGGRKLPAPVTVLPAAPTVPPPPDGLKDSGRRQWQQLWTEIPWLSPAADLNIVSRYCQMAELHTEIMSSITNDGLRAEGYKGQARPNPLITQATSIAKELRAIEQQLGLTPSSRSVLGFVEVRRLSKLDELAARRQASSDSRQRRRP